MQLMEVRHVSRRRRGRRGLIALALAALGVSAWLAYEPAKVRYRAWKRGNALEQARASIAKQDVTKTQLALDVALHAGPADPDTIRVAAEMLEQVGAPQSLRLRRAVTRQLPDSAADGAALVLACLRFRDFNGARDALRAMPPKTAAEPPALQAALAYALATGDHPVADLILQQLRTTEPDNDALAYTHAVLRLKLPRTEDREAATAELEQIVSRRPDLRMAADRQLAAAATTVRDYAGAKRYWRSVLSRSDASFSDRLQLANLELLVDEKPFPAVFAELTRVPVTAEADAAQLLQWLVVQNRTREASSWVAALAPTTRESAAVRRIEADLAARSGDWDTLQPLLRAGAWGPISDDTLRLVAAARAVDSPEKPGLRKDVWDLALNSAANRLPALTTLLRLASTWNWTVEYERSSWSLVRSFPDQYWVAQELFNHYKARKDTHAMREVLGRLREIDPAVPRYQHDWALLSLLLEPSSKWDAPKAIVQQLYQQAPQDATYATGYAVALAQADRSEEALAVVDKMTADDRAYPPRQPFLAFVYGLSRQAARFDAAKTEAAGMDLLPEEKLLIQRGQEGLLRPTPKTAAPKTGVSKS